MAVTVSRLPKLVFCLALLSLALPASALAQARFHRNENISTPTSKQSSRPTSGSALGRRSTAEAPSGLLFDGERLGDFGIESAPHAITEVPDPISGAETVFKNRVTNSGSRPNS
jgi:hypothetical protein